MRIAIVTPSRVSAENAMRVYANHSPFNLIVRTERTRYDYSITFEDGTELVWVNIIDKAIGYKFGKSIIDMSDYPSICPYELFNNVVTEVIDRTEPGNVHYINLEDVRG